MDKSQISKIIHDSHEVLAPGYGDLDMFGKVDDSTLEHWNYHRNVKSPITHIVRNYMSKKDFTMLDAGCGNGQLLHIYSELGAKTIYGVDFGNSMLKLAAERARVNNINFVPLKGRLEDLSFINKNIFDLINLYGVIEHLHDPVTVLRELENVLAPKGIMIVAVPRKYSLAWMTYFLFCRSLADYVGQENFMDKFLRRKKMVLYKFFNTREIQDIISSLGRLKLLHRIPIAHGGLVGSANSPLRVLARKGRYRSIDQWNNLCRRIGLTPAGEYVVFRKQ